MKAHAKTTRINNICKVLSNRERGNIQDLHRELKGKYDMTVRRRAELLRLLHSLYQKVDIQSIMYRAVDSSPTIDLEKSQKRTSNFEGSRS